MKHKISSAFFALFMIASLKAQVGVGTITPDASSVLDISAADKGVLIPRVSLSDVSDTMLDGINTAATGLLIYNANAATTGGNGVGYYYFNGTIWEQLSTATVSGDHDFYEEGTTTAPDNINDDMYRQGNLAIGKTTADYPIDIQTSQSTGAFINVSETTGSGTAYGQQIRVNGVGASLVASRRSVVASGNENSNGTQNFLNNGSGNGYSWGYTSTLFGAGSGDKRGLFTTFDGSSTGVHYGIYNYFRNANGVVYGLYNLISSSPGLICGTNNQITSNGNGIHYGSYNNLSGTGAGEQYGTLINISNSGNANHYGLQSTLSGSGGGNHYGMDNTLSGSGTGEQFGVRNRITNNGDNLHYGAYNALSGIGNGRQYGTYNLIDNSGINNHYGSYNLLSGVGTGTQVGDYSRIDNSGNGTHYGEFIRLEGNGSGTHNGTEVQLSGTGNGAHLGTINVIDNSGTGLHYGSYNVLRGTGSGTHYGNWASLEGTGVGNQTATFNTISNAGDGVHIGVDNQMSGNGNGIHAGINNRFTGTGGGTQYGLKNYFFNNAASNAQYGVFTELYSSGNGSHMGVYSVIDGNGSGTKYGAYNLLGGNGGGTKYGVFTQLAGTGSGDMYGSRILLSNSGNGTQHGNYTQINGTGTGIKYGSYIRMNTTAGGTHYGVYSEALKVGSFAGLFLGNLGIGTTIGNYYTLPPSRGTNGQLMQTDGTGNVSWVDDPSPSYWSRTGTVLNLANAGDDINFTNDQTTITFPASLGTPAPMMHMFSSGFNNSTKMVIAHSSGFSDYGLSYDDTDDSFQFLSAGANVVEVDLTGTTVLSVVGNVNVNGDIITDTNTYPDYVFEKYFGDVSEINPNYNFLSLSETKAFILKNGHLPGVKSYVEVQNNNMQIDLSEVSVTNLEKIEELFLYAIEARELIEKQQVEIEMLKKEFSEIKAFLKDKK